MQCGYSKGIVYVKRSDISSDQDVEDLADLLRSITTAHLCIDCGLTAIAVKKSLEVYKSPWVLLWLEPEHSALAVAPVKRKCDIYQEIHSLLEDMHAYS